MDNTLFESEYIFGIHEPGGEQHMIAAGKPGWVLFTEGIGHNPNDRRGADYSPYSSQGLGVISRLNNGYAPAGTIPHSRHYHEFAQRCANFVANSSGCHIWIIGNEMNFKIERPPASTPDFASPAHEPANEPPEKPTEKPTEKSLWSGVLKAVSGGMGLAELGDNTKPSGATSDSEYLPDPFGRDDPERFSALYQDKNFRKNRQFSQKSQDSPGPSHSVGGEVITPGLYVSCYSACRDAIHNVPGHEHDQVLIGAVAPWNTNTAYLENRQGDWILYFRHILELLGPEGCDGITLHTYTHGADPNLIYDSAKMNKPFEHCHYHFKTYQDFMHAIPEEMRHLPVYITETDEDVAWRDINSGWVRNAYGEINHWNQQPDQQQIRALILYRWPKHDKWAITDKSGVIDDFREALVNDYRWGSSGFGGASIETQPLAPTHPLPPAEPFTAGMVISINTLVNLRQTAGYLNKPNHDRLLELPAQTRVHILDSHPVEMDQLVWWQVQTLDERGALMQGWLAQFDPQGTPLLKSESDTIQGLYQPIYDQPIQVGARIQMLTGVYVRLTPGHQDKAETDMITVVPKGYDLTVAGGPESVHGLTWWLVYDSNNPGRFLGWVTDSWPDESGNLQLLAQPVESLDQSNIPFSQLPKPETLHTAATLGAAYLYDLSITDEKEEDGKQELEAENILVALPAHTAMTLLAGPLTYQGQRWWKIETQLGQHATQGWLAEKEIEFYMIQPDLTHFAAEQFAIQDSISSAIAHSPTAPVQPFQVGDLIYTTEAIRLYPAVGSTVTLEEGTISYLWPGAQAQLVDGPTMLYEQRWWQLETRFQNGDVQQGWTQEAIPGGKPLFVKFGSSQPEQQYRPFSQPTIKKPADKFTTGDIAASQPPELDLTIWRSGLQVLSKEPTPLYRTAVASESRFSDEIPPKVMGILAPDIPARVLMKPRKIGGRYWACIKGQNKKEEMIHGWTPLVAKDGWLLFKLASDASKKPEDKQIEMDQPTVTPVVTQGEKPVTSVAGVLQIGTAIATTDHVRMRHTPGYLNQPQDNFITELPSQHRAKIIGGPEDADGLRWWQVETHSFSGNVLTGWVAERSPDGQLLLDQVESDLNSPVKSDKQRRHKQGDSTEERLSVDAQHHTKYPPNQLLTSTVWLYVRLTPGDQYKTSNDIVGTLRPYTTVNIIEGPLMADDLHWYRVGGITDHGHDVVGWVAAHGTDGTTYLSTASKLPSRNIPNPRLGGRGYLTTPFIGRFGISQLWGENADIYAKYAYDGVSLVGHNGIDFLTYVGTPIVAVDSGTVLRAEFGFGGFGNFVLLGHRWGQSVYAHLDERYVDAGDSVSAGTRLGVSGNTGNSTGPHLHFAIRINPYWRADGWGGYTDPLPYLYPGDVILPRYVLPFTRGLADPDVNVRVTEHLPPSTMSLEEPENGRP